MQDFSKYLKTTTPLLNNLLGSNQKHLLLKVRLVTRYLYNTTHIQCHVKTAISSDSVDKNLHIAPLKADPT